MLRRNLITHLNLLSNHPWFSFCKKLSRRATERHVKIESHITNILLPFETTRKIISIMKKVYVIMFIQKIESIRRSTKLLVSAFWESKDANKTEGVFTFELTRLS